MYLVLSLADRRYRRRRGARRADRDFVQFDNVGEPAPEQSDGALAGLCGRPGFHRLCGFGGSRLRCGVKM